MDWFQKTLQGVILRIKVQPNAKKSAILGLHGNPPRLKVKIAAPAADNKANQELVRFLRENLSIAQSKIEILRGEKAQQKDVLCRGITEEAAAALLKEIS